jgi:hypothetical protein
MQKETERKIELKNNRENIKLNKIAGENKDEEASKNRYAEKKLINKLRIKMRQGV